MSVKVSIQGYEGSFHQQAARIEYGQKVEVIPCNNFGEVAKRDENKKETNGGFMGVENAIACSILPN